MTDTTDENDRRVSTSLSIGWKYPFTRRGGAQTAVACFVWPEFNGVLPRVFDSERIPPRDMFFAVIRYEGPAVWVVCTPEYGDLFEFLDLMTREGVPWVKVEVVRQQPWPDGEMIEV